MDTPFYTWTISEALSWLGSIPYLGLPLMVVAVGLTAVGLLYVLALGVTLHAKK